MNTECKESIEEALEKIRKTIEEGKKSVHSEKNFLDDPGEVLELTNIVQEGNELEEYKITTPRSEDLISEHVKQFTKKLNLLAQDNYVVSEAEIHALFKEMLKPYLKSWLNNNLQDIAKEVLEAEVKKIFNKNI